MRVNPLRVIGVAPGEQADLRNVHVRQRRPADEDLIQDLAGDGRGYAGVTK